MLLTWGQFTAHSGRVLDWKIECDALNTLDWECAARMIKLLVPPFGDVIGIPRGGMKLEFYLKKLVVPGDERVLIVDDVFTTGGSMSARRGELTASGVRHQNIIGAVLFSRGQCPYWITPVFSLNAALQK